jgi:nucleoside-diphosphate-sugar epimerase
MKIVVIGRSGLICSKLVAKLRESGHQALLAARKQASTRARRCAGTVRDYRTRRVRTIIEARSSRWRESNAPTTTGPWTAHQGAGTRETVRP